MPTETRDQLKAALEGLRRLKGRVSELEAERRAPIAVVGVAGRFPGSPSETALWDLVRAGRSAVGPVPADRWDGAAYARRFPDLAGLDRGGFLDDPWRFDAEAFRIRTAEAAAMDPQQRVVLETAAHALEDAGLRDAAAGSATGVFLGVALSDWAKRTLHHPDPTTQGPFTGTGAFHSVVAGRVAYALDLRGPAIALDTACSSSLVAVDQAVTALRLGDCDVALAGGVNLLMSPDVSLAFARMLALSPTGRCQAFDARADGYVRSEAVAVVALMRLDEALSQGRRVHAVIRGTAVAHDGTSNGLTAPSRRAQAAVVRAALAEAGVEPEAVGFVASHGTGTRLGDPIEYGALVDVYGQGAAPLWLGAVKANVGHTETAAGITGLVSAVHVLRHGEVPPIAGLGRPNPELPVAAGRLALPREPTPFLGDAVGVSSFGMSGTNAHVVLTAPPTHEAPERPVLTVFGGERHVLPDPAEAARAAALPAPAPPSVVPPADLGVTVRRLVADALGAEAAEVDAELGFFDQGLDSLGATELARALERALGRPVRSTVAFDHPTLVRLVNHLGEAPSEPVARTTPTASRAGEPVAVVGVACRLPGADHPDAFWTHLVAGDDRVVDGPPARWADLVADGEVVATATVSGLEDFDPLLFGMSPREAEAMDPQQRLWLEVAWGALQDAAVDPAVGRTGVWVGIAASEYGARFDGTGSHAGVAGAGNDTSFAAGRVAHVLGLTGPAVAIDTACSSGLVAVHQAVRALHAGDADLAVAGAVNALVDPRTHRLLTAIRALSPTGRCRPFSDRADGYVRAEGAVAFVLAPLSVARARGLRVWGVVHGTAVDHDGRGAGLTVPNGPAQEAVLRAAWARAGVTADDLGFVEAHGTGTQRGDPIEAGALADAAAGRGAPLPLTASKSVVGHTEAAAGAVGMLAALLALRAGRLPGIAHLERVNPEVAGFSGLALSSAARPLEGPALAGVSSFGISGTNAHVVVGPGAPVDADADDAEGALLTLAAPTTAALHRLRDAVLAAPGRRIDRSATSLLGRTAGHVRAALWLTAEGAETVSEGEVPDARPRVAFVCPGAGELPPMATLWNAFGPFRDAVEALASSTAGVWADGLSDRIRVGGGGDAERVAVSVALGRAWMSLGVRPAVVVGHGLGDLAAAWLGGVFDDATGARMVSARAEALAAAAPGRRVALRVAPERLQQVLAIHPRVAVAAWNAPGEVILGGPPDEVDAAVAALAPKVSRVLAGAHAAHTPHAAEATATLRTATPALQRPARVVRTSAAQGPLDEAATWADAVSRPVAFADVVAATEADLFLELAPVPTLVGPGRRADPARRPWLASHHAARGPASTWEVLGQLWVAGIDADLEAAARATGGRRIPLPAIPPDRRRCWVELPEAPSAAREPRDGAPAPGSPASPWRVGALLVIAAAAGFLLAQVI